MSVGVGTILERFKTALQDEAFIPSKYAESLMYESEGSLNKSFCVRAISSQHSSYELRGAWQSTSSWQGEVFTEIQIDIAFKLRGDNHFADYVSAMSLEETAFKACLALNRAELKVQPGRVVRSLSRSDNSFLICQITFQVAHRQAYGA